MKQKLKYLITALVVATTLSITAVSASANEATEPSVDEYEIGEETNFFSRVYEEILAYTGEIFCALTLAGSLSLAVAYKKGLLPLIEKSLLSIGGAIAKIKDSTNEYAKTNSALSQSIDKQLESSATALNEIASKVNELSIALEKSIKDEGEARREKEQLRIIIGAQIDMLYDVFMSSALPQYQKDEVGERIAVMREAIAANEDK